MKINNNKKVAKFRQSQKCRLLNWIQFIQMKRKSLQDDNLIVRWELFPANFDVCSMSRCRHRFNWREGVKFRILGCNRRQDKIVTFLLKILCFTFYRVTKQVLDGELLLKIMEIRKISKSHEIRQIEVRSILSLKVNIISRFPRQIYIINPQICVSVCPHGYLRNPLTYDREILYA